MASKKEAPPTNNNHKKVKAAASSNGAANGAPLHPAANADRKNHSSNAGAASNKSCSKKNKSNEAQSPEYILALKKKLHREIFEKCVEKKMLQDFEFWDN